MTNRTNHRFSLALATLALLVASACGGNKPVAQPTPTATGLVPHGILAPAQKAQNTVNQLNQQQQQQEQQTGNGYPNP